MMIDVDEAVYKILADLKAKDVYAVVAGGYCRDIYFEKPYRDIDIFIQIKPSEDLDYLVSTVLGYFYTDYDDVESDGVYEGDTIPHIRYSYSFDYKGLPINLIFKGFNDLPSLLDTFNFGINMVGFDLDHWVLTPKFIKDENNKTITWYNRVDDSNYKRWERLQVKYPYDAVDVDGNAINNTLTQVVPFDIYTLNDLV